MSKRFIGIDLEGQEVRVAVLSPQSGKIAIKLEKRGYTSPEEAVDAITEILGGAVLMGDRMVTALPCRQGLFRRLRFPFREKSKIKAALPLELEAQLPVNLEEFQISFLLPRPRDNDYEVDAVVVNQLEIAELLQHFPEPEQNPRKIDYFPFGLLPALKQQEGILIYCRRLEVVVALVFDGIIWDYRLLPGTTELAEDEVLDFISNQVSQLENAIGQENLPLWIIGAGVTKTILTELQKSGRTIIPPAADIFGPELSCAMAPAALLALGELQSSRKTEQLDFRKGTFAARGQLEQFRSKLVVAIILLLLILLGGAFAMHLGYLQKSQELSTLKQQLSTVFKQTMPANTPLVDIPSQLDGQLQELQHQKQLFGLGGLGSASVLQQLSSSIDADITVDLDEFTYNRTQVQLTGSTDSFDSVNQIAEELGNNRLFSGVEIADAKLAADNSQVNFELQLQLSGGTE